MFCENCASPLNNFGSQPPPPPSSAPGQPAGQSSQRALIAMILAIAALLCCGPFAGVPAAIVAWLELDAIKNGRSPASGKTMATISLWVGIAASVIHIGLWFVWMVFGALMSSPSGY